MVSYHDGGQLELKLLKDGGGGHGGAALRICTFGKEEQRLSEYTVIMMGHHDAQKERRKGRWNLQPSRHEMPRGSQCFSHCIVLGISSIFWEIAVSIIHVELALGQELLGCTMAIGTITALHAEHPNKVMKKSLYNLVTASRCAIES
eukprot:214435-Pelagomonas_calceolata.AAC.8